MSFITVHHEDPFLIKVVHQGPPSLLKSFIKVSEISCPFITLHSLTIDTSKHPSRSEYFSGYAAMLLVQRLLLRPVHQTVGTTTSLSVATMSRTHAVLGDAFLDFLDEQLQFANRHGVSFEQAGWFLEKRREMDDVEKRKKKQEAPPAYTLHHWQDLDALLEDYCNSVTIRTDTTPSVRESGFVIVTRSITITRTCCLRAVNTVFPSPATTFSSGLD
jgi:hypothetical protein